MDNKHRIEIMQLTEMKAAALELIMESDSFILIGVERGKGSGVLLNGKVQADLALALMLHKVCNHTEFEEKLKEVIEILNKVFESYEEVKNEPTFKKLQHLKQQYDKKDSN